MKLRRLALCVVGSIGLSCSSAAANLVIDESGRLIGATGVDVNGTLYDVEFVEGTCSEVFDGCDDLSDFAFDNPANANLAARALLDQVFLDGPGGKFGFDPNGTFGCSAGRCIAMTPYRIADPYFKFAGSYDLAPVDGLDYVYFGTNFLFWDSASDPQAVWAVWTVSVPIPGSLPLLLAGLGGIAILRRRPGSI